MEKDFSGMSMVDVHSYIEEIRERDRKVYNEEIVNCEEGECMVKITHLSEALEVSAENPGVSRAHSQLQLAESSLYWAGKYKEEKDWSRAAEQISFARVQLRAAEEELNWGGRWQGNT